MRLKQTVQMFGVGCVVIAVSVQSHSAGAQSSQPRFEVASVKRLPPGGLFGRLSRGGPGTSDPARIIWNLGLGSLTARAYGVREDQIVAPDWVWNGNQYGYTIAATMPPGTTNDQLRLMLQDLLAERFHLALHRQTRKFPGYELLVAPGGPKMKQVPADDPAPLADTASDAVTNRVQPDVDGFPKLPIGRPNAIIGPGLGKWGTYRGRFHESIGQFLLPLSYLINQSNGDPTGSPVPRVVDRTGLTGVYAFTLEFSGGIFFDGNGPLARALADKAGDSSSVPVASEPAGRRGGGTTIFSALEKQLGLQLKKTKDVDGDILVIDHADKDPVEN